MGPPDQNAHCCHAPAAAKRGHRTESGVIGRTFPSGTVCGNGAVLSPAGQHVQRFCHPEVSAGIHRASGGAEICAAVYSEKNPAGTGNSVVRSAYRRKMAVLCGRAASLQFPEIHPERHHFHPGRTGKSTGYRGYRHRNCTGRLTAHFRKRVYRKKWTLR